MLGLGDGRAAEHIAPEGNIEAEASSVYLAGESAFHAKPLSSVEHPFAGDLGGVLVGLDLECHEVLQIELSGCLQTLEQMRIRSEKDEVDVSRGAGDLEPD